MRSVIRPRRWLSRRLVVSIAALVVLAGIGTVSGISLAGTDDGFDSTDALADAARIPNDQGPDPCPSASTGASASTGKGNTKGGKGGKPTPAHNHGAVTIPPKVVPSGNAAGAALAVPAAVPSDAAADPATDPTDAADPTDVASVDPAASADPAATDSAAPPVSASPAPSSSAPVVECHGADTPPPVSDFVDIKTVKANVKAPKNGRNASKGTFVSVCGKNANLHRNPDNFIVAPGVSDGAHHTHDYVGNLSTDGNATDASMAAAGTTCRFGDLSTYYWPVIRTLAKPGADANADGGGNDGNVGTILAPSTATIQYRGNAQSKVTAMPRFLRIITGDAKAQTNGPANAKAAWTCSGFTNRTTTEYPLCPTGSKVMRVLDYPSCWDGINIDSANHRSHIVFPLASGRCPKDTKAVPQIRLTLSYSVPKGPSFALDSFPAETHNPITDHADYENVMPANLMAYAVNCINSGRNC